MEVRKWEQEGCVKEGRKEGRKEQRRLELGRETSVLEGTTEIVRKDGRN